MKKENAFLQKLDKIGNLTQVVCLSLFLTGVSVQGVSAETGFPISQSVQQTKTVTGQVVDETGEPVIGASVVVEGTTRRSSDLVPLLILTEDLLCKSLRARRLSFHLWGMCRKRLLRNKEKTLEWC